MIRQAGFLRGFEVLFWQLGTAFPLQAGLALTTWVEVGIMGP